MTDQMISPEDRERLAKTKFGEWFNEMWDNKFKELESIAGQSHQEGQGQQQGQQQSSPPQGQQQQQAPSGRRRSLLEECLSQTFGF